VLIGTGRHFPSLLGDSGDPSAMLDQWLNSFGITAAAIGAYMLFRWGLPFRNRTGGAQCLELEQESRDDRILEKRADRLGLVGLALGLVGSALQVAAVWL
jgi:hypothetical protein